MAASVFPVLRRFVALAVLAVLLQAPASQGDAADRTRLEAFLEITGFDVALDSIALSASDAPAMLGMDEGDFGSDWTRIADQVFDTETMRGLALDILSQTLSDELLTHAAGFYASPLGQRLVEVENISHLDEDEEARVSIGTAAIDAGGARIDSLRRMNEAIDSSGIAVRAVQEIQIRFLMAASGAGVLESELDEAALRAYLKSAEAEMREALKASGLISAAYTYRDLNDEDLAAYAEALEHPDMKRVYGLMNAVQFEIMANRFELLARRMAELTPGQEL